MTAAAFRASYADWKLIKTRSVVQIVFEVPLEAADAAYQVLDGMPNFGSEHWFAIAKLSPEAKEQEPEPVSNPPAQVRRAWSQLPPSQQAAMRCNEISFQRFLQEKYRARWKILPDGTDAEKAAELVRVLCGVESRRLITAENVSAFDRWMNIDDNYRLWMQAVA